MTPAWAYSVPLATQNSSMRSSVEGPAPTMLEASFIRRPPVEGPLLTRRLPEADLALE
jgi:hypothetical protein